MSPSILLAGRECSIVALKEQRMTPAQGIRLNAIAFLTLTCFYSKAQAQNIDFQTIEIQTVKIADGLYLLMGGPAQGNILVSTGSDGILLVDTMYAPMHQKITDALAKISNQSPNSLAIRYVVNTHLHGDHTAG